jgi:DNA-binding NarL/FixJ family response regulator
MSSEPTAQLRRARVLIVEDHPVLRGVVRLACEHSPDLVVVGVVEDGERALEECREVSPDLIVLDLTLPGALQGLDVAMRLRDEGSSAKILVLTGRTDDRSVFDSIRAGADGFLEKTAGVRFIAETLTRVAGGERIFTPEQERGAIQELGRMSRKARVSSAAEAKITSRELEILEFVSEGLTVKQVATRLGLSPRTVEAHVARLYRKLGVRNRVQAISRAVSLDLIQIG